MMLIMNIYILYYNEYYIIPIQISNSAHIPFKSITGEQAFFFLVKTMLTTRGIIDLLATMCCIIVDPPILEPTRYFRFTFRLTHALVYKRHVGLSVEFLYINIDI